MRSFLREGPVRAANPTRICSPFLLPAASAHHGRQVPRRLLLSPKRRFRIYRTGILHRISGRLPYGYFRFPAPGLPIDRLHEKRTVIGFGSLQNPENRSVAGTTIPVLLFRRRGDKKHPDNRGVRRSFQNVFQNMIFRRDPINPLLNRDL